VEETRKKRKKEVERIHLGRIEKKTGITIVSLRPVVEGAGRQGNVPSMAPRGRLGRLGRYWEIAPDPVSERYVRTCNILETRTRNVLRGLLCRLFRNYFRGGSAQMSVGRCWCTRRARGRVYRHDCAVRLPRRCRSGEGPGGEERHGPSPLYR